MSETNMPQMPEDQLPQAVVAELRKQSGAPVGVPRSVDETILADARAVLRDVAAPDRPRPLRRTWAIGVVSVGSLAAALLLAVTASWTALDRDRTAVPSVAETTVEATGADSSVDSVGLVAVAFLKEDVDRDGNVDILDAFMLARRIPGSEIDPQNGDQNGDGVLDETDVERVAMRAVML